MRREFSNANFHVITEDERTGKYGARSFDRLLDCCRWCQYVGLKIGCVSPSCFGLKPLKLSTEAGPLTV